MKNESLRFPIKATALGENKNLLNSFRQPSNRVEKGNQEAFKISQVENLLVHLNNHPDMFQYCNQFIDFKSFIKTVKTILFFFLPYFYGVFFFFNSLHVIFFLEFQQIQAIEYRIKRDERNL
jgi:hypothetical protein